MRSSRLLTTTAVPPAVFFVFVNPTTTQKPMNSTSTNTVLAPSPWSAPIAICTTSPVIPPPPTPGDPPARRSTRGHVGPLPSRRVRPCDAAEPRPRGAAGHPCATAWPAGPRRRRTGTDFRSAAAARVEPSAARSAGLRRAEGSCRPCPEYSLTCGQDGLEGRDAHLAYPAPPAFL